MDAQGDTSKKFSPFHKPSPQKQSTADADVSAVQSQSTPPTLPQLEKEIKIYLGKTAQNIIEVGKRLTQAAGGTIHFGHVKNFSGAVVDEALALVMRAPKSYTRENVIELQCHGSSVALREVLKLTFEAGARPAERGEFTKRAFLNGRIDLTQAQAVLDVIQAKTSAALTVAQNQLAGKTSETLREIRRAILNSAAHIEATIDFPEDDLDAVILREVDENISAQIERLNAMLKNQSAGKILRDGLETAIIGKPNVGKSSLLNFFAKTDRAIVTDIPGTTRDSIEEFVNVGGIPLKWSKSALPAPATALNVRN